MSQRLRRCQAGRLGLPTLLPPAHASWPGVLTTTEASASRSKPSWGEDTEHLAREPRTRAPGVTAAVTDHPSPGSPLGLRRKRDVLFLPDVFLVGAAVVKLLYPFLTTCFEQGNISLNENERWRKQNKFQNQVIFSASPHCKSHSSTPFRKRCSSHTPRQNTIL